MARPSGGRHAARGRRRDEAQTPACPLPGRAGVLVVGGGASGLAAAVAAARAGAEVVVVEASRAPGRPVLASGNGRCNLTNAALGADWEPRAGWPLLAGPGAPAEGRPAGPAFDLYSDPAFARAVMGADPLGGVLGLFGGLGLWCVADEQGRYFPLSRHAQSVLSALLAELGRLGVTVCCDSRVTSVEPAGPGWDVGLDDGRRVRAGRVVWAAGGGSAGALADLGLALRGESPVLCPLACPPADVAGLDGVRAACVATLRRAGAGVVARERGEVLFRPYGVSGIVAFDLSRHALAGDELELDLVGDALRAEAAEPRDEGVERLRGVVDESGRGASHESLEDARVNLDLILRDRLTSMLSLAHDGPSRLRLLDGVLHPALARRVMELACGSDGDRGVDVGRLACLLLRFTLRVEGTADAAHAQVTRGGVANDEVDPATMEVRAHPGLFLCGEALDVDAACGGFNLTWAWLSGLRAGATAARG